MARRHRQPFGTEGDGAARVLGALRAAFPQWSFPDSLRRSRVPSMRPTGDSQVSDKPFSFGGWPATHSRGQPILFSVAIASRMHIELRTASASTLFATSFT